MPSLFRKVLLASAIGGTAVTANAVVYNFNDLGAPSEFFTTPYQSFLQLGDNNPATNDWFWRLPAEQAPQNPGAGNSVAVFTASCPLGASGVCGVRESQPIVGATPFFLNSFYISGDQQNVTVNLYTSVSDTIPVFSEGINLTPVSPNITTIITYTPSFGGAIQKMSFTGFQGFFAVDDINVTAVPEPATYAMLLGGLALVGAAARRQRKA